MLLGDRSIDVPAWLRAGPRRDPARDPSCGPADLAEHLDPQSRLVLCRRLVREGLLEIRGVTQPDLGAGFRCAGASLLRDEPIAGTASNVRAFLLVEHTGAWGVNALRDARLPVRARQPPAAVLACRRGAGRCWPGVPTAPATDDVRVFAAYADPVAPWLESAAFTDIHEVLDLDLAALGRGRSLGLEPTDGSLFCVCTHGRHDACCAERGRPVAAALEAAHPEETWEVSHIGGDRFAANMVVLPHGLYYGRLDAAAALGVAGTHLAGGLDLDHLRGRSGLRMPVQAAEIALRRQLEETRNDAVRFLGASARTTTSRPPGSTSPARRTPSGSAPVAATTQRLTCQATRDNPVPIHDLLDVIDVLRRYRADGDHRRRALAHADRYSGFGRTSFVGGDDDDRRRCGERRRCRPGPRWPALPCRASRCCASGTGSTPTCTRSTATSSPSGCSPAAGRW